MKKTFWVLALLLSIQHARADVFECAYNTVDGVPVIAVSAYYDEPEYKAEIRYRLTEENINLLKKQPDKKLKVVRKTIDYSSYNIRNAAFEKCKAIAKDYEIVVLSYTVESSPSGNFAGGTSWYPGWRKKSTGEVSDDRWIGIYFPSYENQVEEVVDLICDELQD